MIQVRLHSIFRELLPPEARGSAQVEVPEGSSLRDLMAKLSLEGHVICSVNEELERSFERVLQEGDVVRFLRPSGGGSL